MCGISGLITISNFDNGSSIVQNMNNRIIHRGPDAEGIFESGNVHLGHRRLSILDLSAAANQPFHKHGFTIVYNGEIYNYLELKEDLKKEGYDFLTDSDTEVILSAYHFFGKDCVEKFNGMWSFLLLDTQNETLLVSRDQFGIKPLYYFQTADLLSFGSEIKQFLEVPGFKPQLNKKIAATFLVEGSLNQSQETFFDSVFELQPGTNLTIDTKTRVINSHVWYSFIKETHKKNALSYEQAVLRFDELFEDAVKIRMRSDVRVGSCLSGGIDSSAIVCKAKELGANLETVTSCYSDAKFDEQQFSDLVSNTTGFKSNKIYGDKIELDRFEIIKKMIYHQDQPIATGSHFSEYNVFSEARKHGFIVMLDGQGSDEYLGGYPEFQSILFQLFLKKFQFKKLFHLVNKESLLYRRTHKEIIFRELKSMFYFPILKQIKKVLGKENKEYANNLLNNYKPTFYKPKSFTELSILELVKTSLPYQLHSEDRNSMLFSIESRLPFLDYRLVEFCLTLPDSYLYREAYTKKILRDAVKSLPTPIKERKDKMGFVSPDEQWVKENKKIFVEVLTKAKEKYGFVSDLFLEQFQLFLDGKRTYEPKYFRALSLVYFCEEFNIQ